MILTNRHEYTITPYYKISDTLYFLWLRVDSIYKISCSQVKHFPSGVIKLKPHNPVIYLKRSEWQGKFGFAAYAASIVFLGAGIMTKKEEFYWTGAGFFAVGTGFIASSLISQKRYAIITMAIPFNEHLRPPE